MECLNGTPCYCSVERKFENNVAFVQCLHPSFCNYQFHFGSAVGCSCPVRIELFEKYGV
jgi:hypothetical protein